MAIRAAEPTADQASAHTVVEQIKAFIAHRDPQATFSAVYPAPDPGIWVIDARVSPYLAGDMNFREALAEQEVDLMTEHGVHLATLLLARHPAPRPDPASRP